MEETGKVALVRRVYRNDSRVRIGVLSPRIKLHYEVIFSFIFIFLVSSLLLASLYHIFKIPIYLLKVFSWSFYYYLK